MRKGKMDREDVVKIAGEALVRKLEGEPCEPTNRVQTDGTDDVEFSASIKFEDAEGTERTLTAYYYQTREDYDSCEDDSFLDWEINGFEIW